MLRLAVVTTLLSASLAAACPWLGNCCKRRTVYYVPVPPPAAALPPQKEPEKPAVNVFDPTAVYERVVRSCVMIVAPGRDEPVLGTGFLIDTSRMHVMTSSRAVPNDTVSVVFPIVDENGTIVNDRSKTLELVRRGKAIKARVIKRDRTRNLALLQLEALPNEFWIRPLPLAEINGIGTVDASPDETLIHIANDAKLDYVFIRLNHKVARIEEREAPRVDISDRGPSTSAPPKIEFLQTYGPLSNDTGGPLINKYGQVVGLWDDARFGIPAVTLHRSISAREIRAFLDRKEKTEDDWPRYSPLPAPKDDREREAAQLFQRAKLFARGDDNRPIYFNKLEELIKKYPDTPAAKEAKKILDAKKK